MYLFQYNLLESRFESNIIFLHIWTVILMYYVYGNRIIIITVIVKVWNNLEWLKFIIQNSDLYTFEHIGAFRWKNKPCIKVIYWTNGPPH